MKKFLILLFVCFNFFVSNVKVKASNPSLDDDNLSFVNEEKHSFSDGSFILVKTYVLENTMSGIQMLDLNDVYNRTGIKDVTKYNANNNVEWQYTLYAHFEVTEGVSSRCYSTNYTQNIYNTAWTFSNGNSYYQANTAYGTGVYKYKRLFIVTETQNIDIQITCDIYGNVY